METERICPSCRKPLAPDVPMGLCPECLIKAGFPSESGAPAANFVPPSVEEIAKLFPQLEIIGFLGKGGMGAVYKARQPALNRLVALKVLPSAMMHIPGFSERFNREAQALARLSHPNIVTVHDFGRAGELPYLIMELVDGVNLREMEQTGRLTPEQALAIVPQICEALQYAHNEGIVHRDIKPENLLMDKKGRVKVTDFGIAKIMAAADGKISLTGAKDVVGTPHYMAPEQIEQPQAVDHRADIYSLGVVFYEMLTGELPLGKFQSPSQKVQMDVRLDEVVLRTLEKEPARRYQQVSEVKTRVENIASTPAPPAPLVPAAAIQAGSDKIIFPAFLLAFFFGVFGAHRFYAGKIRSGLAQLGALLSWPILIVAIVFAAQRGRPELEVPPLAIALGVLVCGCGIWATIDWILLVCKAFTDGQGRKMTQWFHPGNSGAIPQRTATPAPVISGRSHAAGFNKAIIVAPAIALMATNGLKIISAFKVLLVANGFVNDIVNSVLSNLGIDLPDLTQVIFADTVIFKLILPLAAIFGAIKMSQLRSYGWALAAAILSIISFSFLNFCVGIWALIVLLRADVRDAFAQRNPQVPPKSENWPWIYAALSTLFVFAILALHLLRFPLAKLSGGTAIFDNDATPVATLASVNTNSTLTASNSNFTNIDVGSASSVLKSFVAVPGGKLFVKLDRGDVHVTGADQNTVEILADRSVTGVGDAEAQRILAEEHLVLKQEGNEISVTAQEPTSLHQHSFLGLATKANLKAHYRITVPRKFETHVETLGGDVETSNIQGDAFAKTAGGEIGFKDITGKVDGHTLGGNIDAWNCGDKMVVHTAGGEIKVKNFSGPSLQASTMGGDVSAEFTVSPKSDCELHTMGGDVTAILPASAAVRVDAHTTGGEVKTDLPMQIQGKVRESSLQGTLNGGGPVLKLSTLGGDIDLRKRAAASQ